MTSSLLVILKNKIDETQKYIEEQFARKDNVSECFINLSN